MRTIALLTIALLLPTIGKAQPETIAKVAIIVDDIGYNRRQGLAALTLPGKITYAIIPHSPNGYFLAGQAQKQQKELILHAPMSAIQSRPLGELGLTEKMNKDDFHQVLNQALASVPHIRGLNNHMGSLLTQKQLPMKWVMRTLNEKGLYFIDSRTTPQSVAWQTAQQYNVPSLKRDVFLDHKRSTEFIHKQFMKLIAIAKHRSYAVAIAHPYPETILYLQNNLKTLAEQGIQLVSASQLVNTYSPNRQQDIHAKM